MKTNKRLLVRLALSGFMIAVSSGTALAGFEWSAPPVVTISDMPAVSAAPAGDVDAATLMPVTDTDTVQVADPQADMPVAPAPDNVSAAPLSGTDSSHAEIMGFGSDIPLALALSQIVPSSFGYSFASGVNPATTVSWNGGKPWDDVLRDSLSPHGLTAVISGNAIVIRQGETEDVSAEDISMSPAAVEAPPVVSVITEEDPALRGEGTANNYPRRSRNNNDFLGSVFSSSSMNKAQADQDVIIENQSALPPPASGYDDSSLTSSDSEGSTMLENDMAAPVAAAYEPAAPAARPLPRRVSTLPPISLAPEDVSYTQETGASHADAAAYESAVPSYATRTRPVLDPFEIRFWQADDKANLKDVLNSWAGNAGVEVIWDSGYDYKLPASIALHGTFPDAITKILSLYGSTEPRPEGRLHPNLPEGPSVLLIENFP